MKKELLLLFGGCSSEYYVSLKSAAAIIRHLDAKLYNINLIGITQNGSWHLTLATPEEIESNKWYEIDDNCKAFISPDRDIHGIIVYDDNIYKTQYIDCVWPILHGKNGEDGSIQGLCELAGIPYIGPGIAASAIGMDKSYTKTIIDSTNVQQAAYLLVHYNDYLRDKQYITKKIQNHFKTFPLFIKPCSAGSSVGITKVYDVCELEKALMLAGQYDNKILIEETIYGQELEVAVLGNEMPITSVVGEIITQNDFYDYNAKYNDPVSRTLIPAEISSDEAKKIQEAAVTVYKALDCKGISRVDFFLTKNKQIIFNEINTLPGFTNISMYPKLWEKSGISYCDLLTKIIDLSII